MAKVKKSFFGPLAFNHPDCIDAIMTDGISTDASFTIFKCINFSHGNDVLWRVCN
nr:hypothetical protein [Escherichia coli]